MKKPASRRFPPPCVVSGDSLDGLQMMKLVDAMHKAKREPFVIYIESVRLERAHGVAFIDLRYCISDEQIDKSVLPHVGGRYEVTMRRVPK